MYKNRTFGTWSGWAYRSRRINLSCSTTRRPVWPTATTRAGKSVPSPVFSGGAIPRLPIRPVWNTFGRMSVTAGPPELAAEGVTSRGVKLGFGSGVLPPGPFPPGLMGGGSNAGGGVWAFVGGLGSGAGRPTPATRVGWTESSAAGAVGVEPRAGLVLGHGTTADGGWAGTD